LPQDCRSTKWFWRCIEYYELKVQVDKPGEKARVKAGYYAQPQGETTP